MTEAYIKFFDNDNGTAEDLQYYHLTTNALDEMRGQSLKKMIPLTYEAMYNNRKEGEE